LVIFETSECSVARIRGKRFLIELGKGVIPSGQSLYLKPRVLPNPRHLKAPLPLDSGKHTLSAKEKG
jgi:hypothetical protein